jgi:uncharacterized damage-inducible protein DinB
VSTAELIERYLDGPATLRQAVEGLSESELDATPIPGKWSIRQVVCHLADSEILYADRMKRILAEHEPALLNADPDRFLAAIEIRNRQLADELQLIAALRRHMSPILKALQPEHFDRIGIHSIAGPLTLREVLQRAVDHILHHVAFIEEKRAAILKGRNAS